MAAILDCRFLALPAKYLQGRPPRLRSWVCVENDIHWPVFYSKPYPSNPFGSLGKAYCEKINELK